ncbi:MAG: transcriptional initiation protein Tat [Gemmatimonadetes bacterium]|nr:MAG: transcriptional initiation protein Tat [Gemmatimonadota bacterium]
MPEMNRRDALKVLGLAPLAASLGVAPDHLDRVSRAVARLEQTGVAAPTFFSAHEWSTVRLLVDYIIPRDERSGSATDAKVPEFIDFLMADNDASLASRTAMHGGLAWLDNECEHRFMKTFVGATDAQRRQVLDDIAWPKKARPEMHHGVAFFSRFRDLTASGFFSSQMGWQDVQYKGNVALPAWNGCPPAALAKLGVSY